MGSANVSAAACYGHSDALDALVDVIKSSTPTQFIDLPQLFVINVILLAANGQPAALCQISHLLAHINNENLVAMLAMRSDLLTNLVTVATSGYPNPLIQIGSLFAKLNPALQSRFDPSKSFRKCYNQHTEGVMTASCFRLFHPPSRVVNMSSDTDVPLRSSTHTNARSIHPQPRLEHERLSRKSAHFYPSPRS